MACNVCGGTVDLCDNAGCMVDLEKSSFKCYESSHFCKRLCWEKWLVSEHEGELKEAEDDER